jgi:hypothetical protein
MATRSTTLHHRPRARTLVAVVLATLVLSVGIVVLASQAISIWSDRAPTPRESVADVHEPAVQLPIFVHPGAHRGQVRVGRFEDNFTVIHPHGPNQRPKWGA